MRRYGFVEGQNLLDDPNGYELRTEQFAGHASEIVDQGVDLIVCVGDDAIRAAQQATKIIPILAGTEDMLGSGFVHSMAKPEGNTTGHSILSFELNGKRQEILMELLPAMLALPPALLTVDQEVSGRSPPSCTSKIKTLINTAAIKKSAVSALYPQSHWRSSGRSALIVMCQPALTCCPKRKGIYVRRARRPGAPLPPLHDGRANRRLLRRVSCSSRV